MLSQKTSVYYRILANNFAESLAAPNIAGSFANNPSPPPSLLSMADPVPLLNAAGESDFEKHHEQNPKLETLPIEPRKVFARRWYVLFVLSLISFTQVRTSPRVGLRLSEHHYGRIVDNLVQYFTFFWHDFAFISNLFPLAVSVLIRCSLSRRPQGWIWNTYGPIAITLKNETVFGWNDAIIAWMGIWGPIGE